MNNQELSARIVELEKTVAELVEVGKLQRDMSLLVMEILTPVAINALGPLTPEQAAILQPTLDRLNALIAKNRK